jgi:hypothetical protein
MFGVEMGDGNPVERSPQILLHPLHESPGKPRQVKTLTEFRRGDYLPEASVTSGLPAFECRGRIDSVGASIESGCSGFRRGALAGNVAAVRTPLTPDGAFGVSYTNRTSLVLGAGHPVPSTPSRSNMEFGEALARAK